MTDKVKIRIGLESVRELELEVADGDAVAAELEAAIADEADLVWLTDVKGNRHGIAVSKLGFVEIEGESTRPGIGFTAVEAATS
ncbi:MAG: DUF3107 family protein [Acidimicrobiia bacterium]